MNRLLGALVLGATTALTGTGAAAAAPSTSVGPDVVGWWSAGNRSPALPAVPPPDVGAKDLYVTGSNALPGPLAATGAGPAAIAALRFQLPAGSTPKQLRLRLSGVHPPTVAVTACRALRPFEAAYGGRWDEAPTYDCSAAGTARLTDAGEVLIEDVDRLRTGRDLAVVLVPGPLDRVVVAAPDTNTLAVARANGSGVSAPTPVPAAAPVAPAGTDPLASGAVPGALAPAGALPAAAKPPAQASTTGPQVAAPGATIALATVPDRPWLALLSTLLLALAAFVPVVRPRRGAVTAGTAGARGVGRFRSERSGTVPDLA